jgi:hypothetical protein
MKWRRSTGVLVELTDMNEFHLLSARNKLKTWLNEPLVDMEDPAPHCDPKELLQALEDELARRAKGAPS